MSLPDVYKNIIKRHYFCMMRWVSVSSIKGSRFRLYILSANSSPLKYNNLCNVEYLKFFGIQPYANLLSFNTYYTNIYRKTNKIIEYFSDFSSFFHSTCAPVYSLYLTACQKSFQTTRITNTLPVYTRKV